MESLAERKKAAPRAGIRDLMKTAKTDLKVMTLAGSDAAMLENNAGAAAAESNNFSASVALPKGSAPLIEISTAVDEQC